MTQTTQSDYIVFNPDPSAPLLKAKVNDLTPAVDPYHKDTGQLLKVVLTIYQDGRIIVDQEYDDNATSADAWHGRIRELKIQGSPTENAVLQFLTDNQASLARIVAGMDQDWDGNNWSGTLTADAADALAELQDELDHGLEPQYEVWAADDWLTDPEALADQFPTIKPGADVDALANTIAEIIETDASPTIVLGADYWAREYVNDKLAELSE